MDFLLGMKILEEKTSPINGKIKVVKSLGFGIYIQVEGLTQSGGVVEDIWRSALRKVKGKRQEVKECLILGLGGGSAAKLVRKFWPASRGEPKAKITGVDIDPVMVEMGKKYMGLDKVQVKIQIQDAKDFLLTISHQPSTIKYDLILVDLYKGHEVPEKFQSENYIQLVRTVLASGGVAVFNRLYFGEKRPEAMKFGKKLEKVFSKVDYFYPEANVMFICYNKD